jgi:hypothetical protein
MRLLPIVCLVIFAEAAAQGQPDHSAAAEQLADQPKEIKRYYLLKL